MPTVPVKQSREFDGIAVCPSAARFCTMEQRRMRCCGLFDQGVIPAEIARQVGVTHQIV